MVYKKSSFLLILSIIGSSSLYCSTLKDTIIKDIIHEVESRPNEENELLADLGTLPLQLQEVIGKSFCKEHIWKSWQTLPLKRSLRKGYQEDQPDTIRGLAFVGDTFHVVTAHFDGKLRWWDTKDLSVNQTTGLSKPFRELDLERGEIGAFAATEDGRRFAVANGSSIMFCDATGPLWVEPLHHSENIFSLSFDATAQLLAVGGCNGSVKVWDLATREAIIHYVHSSLPETQAALNCIYAVGFSSNGLHLYSGTTNSIKVYRIKEATLLKEISLECPGNLLGKMCFIDGDKALTTFMNGTVVTTDLMAATSTKTHIASVPISASCLSRDGKFLIVGCRDRTIRLFGRKNGELHQLFQGEADIFVKHLAFSRDGLTFAYGSSSGAISAISIVRAIEGLTLSDARTALSRAENTLPLAAGRVYRAGSLADRAYCLRKRINGET